MIYFIFLNDQFFQYFLTRNTSFEIFKRRNFSKMELYTLLFIMYLSKYLVGNIKSKFFIYAKVITDYHFFLIFIAPRSSIYPCTYCVKFICTPIDKSRTLLSRFHPFNTLFLITFVPFIIFSFKLFRFSTEK